MLELDYPIKDLVGADYNPREIDEESLKTLRQSIKTLGIVKPIIVSGNLIVAGHQRTKALLAAGIDKAPVYLCRQILTKLMKSALTNCTTVQILTAAMNELGLAEVKILALKWCRLSNCAAICGLKWQMSAMKSASSLSNMATGELVLPLKPEKLFMPDNMFWLAKRWEFDQSLPHS